MKNNKTPSAEELVKKQGESMGIVFIEFSESIIEFWDRYTNKASASIFTRLNGHTKENFFNSVMRSRAWQEYYVESPKVIKTSLAEERLLEDIRNYVRYIEGVLFVDLERIIRKNLPFYRKEVIDAARKEIIKRKKYHTERMHSFSKHDEEVEALVSNQRRLECSDVLELLSSLK